MSDKEKLKLAAQLLITLTGWHNAYGESGEFERDVRLFIKEVDGLGSWEGPDYYENCWGEGPFDKTITYIV